ncbi:TetR/AcrR family transcriptional regulator [Corynebacterium terpenotabidum]|uniref:TetR family transcriptional regulator n=1 Tax=Corynebacterium terpenotabidum Y-11 TaxID=1200352 RepID=S4XFZ5_9CORY|nr:TetR-like C-terminal domain-containing protein [Corynebacterium terpenotabidum]AGP31494.1 TetR family transcriptional regulator [Corynebacterium terpenotabidum Y-11]
MSTSRGDEYHHGNLRQALIDSAVDMLERGERFSLRGVAREVGVSQTAPYRHFSDRSRLESAVATEGFRALAVDLSVGGRMPERPEDLADFAVTYVRFALRRPRMFRLMFGDECDDGDDERVRAATTLREALAATLTSVYPDRTEASRNDLATGLWAAVHGLACLYLDGKLQSASDDLLEEQVRGAFGAVVPER